MTVSDWHFDAFSGRQGLEEVKRDWEVLYDRVGSAHFHQHPVWFAAYLEFLCDDVSVPRLLTLRRGTELMGVWPLTAVRGAGGLRLRELVALCNEHMTHADMLIDPASSDAGGRMLGHLLADMPRWDRLRVPRLREDAKLEASLRERMQRGVLRTPAEGSAWLDCTVPFEDLWRRASANHRSKVTRGWSKARQVGTPRFECASTSEMILPALEVFMDIEASGWKGRAGTAIRQSGRLAGFYRHLALEFSQRRMCEIDVLYLGERPVASVFWFRSGGSLHLQKIGYEESLSKLGPGNLVMHEAISRACEDDAIRTISFITRCPWADGWRTSLAAVNEVTAYHSSWRGRLLHAAALAKQRWRASAKRRTGTLGTQLDDAGE